MTETDPIAACALIVQRGDPARFRATMAAPPAARRVLFPLYAFNIEVARAPWVTAEPMIAEMRLQWWRDALEEIASGGPVRRHEVATPLAEVLDAQGARLLDALVDARRADIARAPFDDDA
ncbi:MAG: squalene/phytoene synthase family protein, partial [Paracoccaceae bacterium]